MDIHEFTRWMWFLQGLTLLRCGANAHLITFFIEMWLDIFATDCSWICKLPQGNEFEDFMVFLTEDCKAIGTFKVKIFEGNTPIHLAIFNWKNLSIESLKFMLRKPEVNVNDESKYGDTLISEAVYGDQSLTILNLLIEYEANYNVVQQK